MLIHQILTDFLCVYCVADKSTHNMMKFLPFGKNNFAKIEKNYYITKIIKLYYEISDTFLTFQ